MKRIIYGILISILAIMPITVFADGSVSASATKLTVAAGETKTSDITFDNVVGDVTITSTDSSVATVDKSSWETGAIESGQTKSVTVTVTGVKAGTATINLVVDGATFDEEEVAKTIAVDVTVTDSKSGEIPSIDTGASISIPAVGLLAGGFILTKKNNKKSKLSRI